MKKYSVVATKSFVRIYKKVLKKYPEVKKLYREALEFLEIDPENTSTKYRIKKLGGVSNGDGPWRIRIGIFRIRYDVFEKEVVLHTIGHRKDIYKW